MKEAAHVTFLVCTRTFGIWAIYVSARGMTLAEIIMLKGSVSVNYKDANMRITPEGKFQVKEFVRLPVVDEDQFKAFQQKFADAPSYLAPDGNRYLFADGDSDA